MKVFLEVSMLEMYSEERWNYAFLEQNEKDMLDEEGMETLFAWYKQEGIENIGYEDPDCYDEGPVGYNELLEVISDVARRMIEEDYFLQRCGKRIPIIIQDLEFADYVLDATQKVNIHDEAHDFFEALESGNM